MVDQSAEEPLAELEPEVNPVEDHIALIFDEDEERLTTVTPLIKVGLEKGELCLYISDEENDLAIVEALKAENIDVDKAVSNGSLILTSKKEMYFKLGRFDPEWTIRVIHNIADLARSYGFTAMRVMSEMKWTQERVAGIERWPEYEAKMNALNPGIALRIICQYDRRAFTPEALMAAIQTHPRIVAEGQVNKNSFFIPTERLLKGNYAQAELDRVMESIRQINSFEAALQERDHTIDSMGRQADADNAARRSLEVALEESRRRFKDLAERSSDWAWELDEQGNYTYSSPRIKDILGLQPEDIIGKAPIDLVSKEAADRTSKMLTRMMSAHAPISALEKEARHKDGHIVYLEMNGMPQFDHDGKFLGYRGVDRDISGRKASKLAIEESRKRTEESLAEIKARDERIATLDGEIEELKGSLSELDASIAALRVDMEGKQSQLAEANEGLARLNESLQGRESELVSLKAAHVEKTSLAESQARDIEALRKQLEDRGGELTGIQAALAAAQTMLHGRTSELEELTSGFKAQSLELKGARDSLSGVEEALAHKEQELFAMRQQVERLEADLKATNDSLAARGDELGRAQNDLAETRTSLEQRSNELTSANEAIAQKARELEAAEGLAHQRELDLTAAKEAIEARSTELSAANASLEQRIAELALATGLAEKRSGELEAANADIERMNGELDAVKASLEKASDDLEAANRMLEERANEISALRTESESKTSEIGSLNESLSQRAAELSAASGLAEQRAGEISTAEERISQLGTELTELKSTIETKDAELAAAASALEQRSSELTAANELLELRAGDLAAANDLHDQKATALAAAEGIIGQREKELAEALAEAASLKASLATRMADLEARTAERDARTEDIARIQGLKASLESELASRGTELAEAIASYEGAKADIAALTEELSLARESMNRSEKDRLELSATIEAKNTEIANLVSRVEMISGDLKSREAELASVNAALSERERDLAQAASRADMLSKVLRLKEEDLSASLITSEARRGTVAALSSSLSKLEADHNVSTTVIDGLRAAMEDRQGALVKVQADGESAMAALRAEAADKERIAAYRMTQIAALNDRVRELEAARDAASGEAERMRRAFMGLPTPAAMVSADGRIIAANPAMERVMVSSGLEGRSASDLWPGLDISEAGAVRVLRDGQEMMMRTLPSALREGTHDLGTVLAFGEPVPVPSTKGPSPEALAHDLNDSLQVIMGSVSLAKEYVIPEGRMYSKLKRIESASVTARDLAGQLMSPAREVHLPAPDTPTSLTRGKGRLLLMDDDENVLEATSDLLRYLGYNVEVARDGEEAVAMCREAEEIWQSYDLAMVDLSITSGMGGMEASKRLVAMNPRIMLIVTSGYVSDSVLADPAAHGFAAALPKPYSAELLSKTIAEVLAGRPA